MDWKSLVSVDEVTIAGLTAGGIRYMMTSSKRSLKEIAMAVVVAWLVAVAAHPWMLEVCEKWGLREESAIGGTGVIAFLAPDILQGLLNIGKTIREEGLLAFLDRFRGK